MLQNIKLRAPNRKGKSIDLTCFILFLFCKFWIGVLVSGVQFLFPTSRSRNPFGAREHFFRAISRRHRSRRTVTPADGAELLKWRTHQPRRPEHRDRPQLSQRFGFQEFFRPSFHLAAPFPGARRGLDVFVVSVNFRRFRLFYSYLHYLPTCINVI